MLFAWSLKEASIYNLKTGAFYFSYHDLFEAKDNVITDMLYMPKYRYVVVSTELGELIVYKWDPVGNPVITEFKGIIGAIHSLQRHPHRINQFITASTDSTIRIWCVEVSLTDSLPPITLVLFYRRNSCASMCSRSHST